MIRTILRGTIPILAILLFFTAGCFGDPQAPSRGETAPESAAIEGGTSGGQSVPAPQERPAPQVTEATLVAIGDIMMHTPQLPGAYNPETKTYDFSGFFASLLPMFQEADWAFANLETPIAGDELGFHGYPRFNAPVALADAMANAGFDIVSTANNHSLDQGYQGLAHTFQKLTEKGLLPIGTADSEEASRRIVILEKNGIDGAFLAYTYGTNGIPVPKDKPWAVQLIDEDRIKADIQRARASGADFVAVSLHFGNEYQRNPSEEQKRIARAAIEAGADVVLGHHPHVVQPYELVQVPREDGTIRQGVIMYSLGNYISNQFGDYKEYGAILTITFQKTQYGDGAAVTAISEIEAIPTWVHKYASGGKSYYRVLPLDQIGQLDDPLLTPRMIASLQDKAKEMNKHLHSLVLKADARRTVSSEVYEMR